MGHDITVLTMDREVDPKEEMALPNPGFRLIQVPLPKRIARLKKYFQGVCSNQKKSTLVGMLFRGLTYPFRKVTQGVLHFLRFKRGIFNACRYPDLTHFWAKPAFEQIKNEGKWDLVISTSGPYAVHLVGERLKREGLTKKWIADFRDPWSGNAIYPGLFPFTLIEKRLEKRLMEQADAITTVTMGFAVGLAALHGNEKVYTIENGFDPIDLQGVSPEPLFPDDGKFRIAHTGTIYYGKQNLSPFFKAVEALKNDPGARHLLDNLEVIFIGPRQTPLRELIAKHGLAPWVRAEGFVSRNRALRLQRDADRLLFFPWNDPRTDGTLTGKIYEYLFSRTPIMAVGRKEISPSQQLIAEANAGDLLADTEQIKRFLVTHLKKRQQKIKNNLDPSFLHRYDRKALAIKLLNISRLGEKKPH